ncbi:unnamed protein product [Rotaria socialis]|uniref:Uncharacterized protein n=1 Tax=Rotaria socialis TaxID=392032 RepID=A0A818HV23_9BILA|nr:unnamed protein product [Rotaria socialis]CAF3786072.1 unnamed protein product [Rotaria socialis]CAF4929399.1 unnamed protein product [Rotaria socialis]CAF4931213.1 unnamed protein product [Rotaria socialis]
MAANPYAGIKYGWEAVQFLQKCYSTEIKMNVRFDYPFLSLHFVLGEFDREQIVFFYFAEQPWYQRMFNWRLYPAYVIEDSSIDDKFKTIEVRCGNGTTAYRDLLNHFHGRTNILQKEILEYLSLYFQRINQRTEEISTEVKVLRKWESGGGTLTVTESDEFGMSEVGSFESPDHRYRVLELIYSIKKKPQRQDPS